MYSTCLFCNSSLGRNRQLERFPVGGRLAFDAVLGRLWVVCPACSRWNLSPLEERWEVIEDCERAYRDTRVRVSTEQIGLARLASGLELVRIGRPMRPEFAAWRYGDQLGKRRRRAMIAAGLGLTGVVSLFAGGVLGSSMIGMYMLYRLGVRAVRGSPNTIVAHIPVGATPDARGAQTRFIDGKYRRASRIELPRKELHRVGFEPLEDRRWSLVVPVSEKREIRLYDEQAMKALALVLPPANRYGGNREMVQDAVRQIEHVGHPLGYVDRIAAAGRRPLKELHPTVRLALEMSTHEEQERRFMEGELAQLEQDWREAEEIAGISDSLLLPASLTDRLRGLRGN